MMSCAGALLDQRARQLADAAELAVPVGVLLAGEHHLAAGERRSLGHGHHRVVRRVRPLVLDQQPAELVDVERDLRDDGAVDAREVGGDQRRLAAVAPEQLDHRDPLVRAGARAQVVDELDAARDRGREADAVVGAVDVVVHRLRDRDHGTPSSCIRSAYESVSSPPIGISTSIPIDSITRSA